MTITNTFQTFHHDLFFQFQTKSHQQQQHHGVSSDLIFKCCTKFVSLVFEFKLSFCNCQLRQHHYNRFWNCESNFLLVSLHIRKCAKSTSHLNNGHGRTNKKRVLRTHSTHNWRFVLSTPKKTVRPSRQTTVRKARGWKCEQCDLSKWQRLYVPKSMFCSLSTLTKRFW